MLAVSSTLIVTFAGIGAGVGAACVVGRSSLAFLFIVPVYVIILSILAVDYVLAPFDAALVTARIGSAVAVVAPEPDATYCCTIAASLEPSMNTLYL